MKKVFKILFTSTLLFIMCFYFTNVNKIKASEFDSNEERELVSLRGANYKIFENSKNERVMKYYFSPIHYYDSGSFVEYDYIITEQEDTFKKEYDQYSVSIPKKIIPSNYIKYSINNQNLEFSLDYNEELNGEIENINDSQILIYTNSEGVRCLEIEINPEGIRICDLNKCNNFGKTKIKFKNADIVETSISNNNINCVFEDNIVSFNTSSSIDNCISPVESTNNKTRILSTNNMLQPHSSYIVENTDGVQVMSITNTSYTSVNLNNLIVDKYIIENFENYNFTLTELRNNKIGLKPTRFIDENNLPLANKMKQIIKLDAVIEKLEATAGFENIKIVYTRTGGRPFTHMDDVTLTANRITSDIEYSEITGVSEYNTVAIGEMEQYSSTEYALDVTNAVENYMNDSDESNFLIEIDSIGFNSNVDLTEDMIQFGSCRSSNSRPYLLVTFESSTLGAALQAGTIEGQMHDSSQNGMFNCFGYALNIKTIATLTLGKEFQTEDFPYYSFDYYICYKFVMLQKPNYNDPVDIADLINLVVQVSSINYNKSVRLLSSKEDIIYNYEYRIAFRIGNLTEFNDFVSNHDDEVIITEEELNSEGCIEKFALAHTFDFHFIRQNRVLSNSTNNWSSKNGGGDLVNVVYFSDYNWPLGDNLNHYDSEIVFFAVSVL